MTHIAFYNFKSKNKYSFSGNECNNNHKVMIIFCHIEKKRKKKKEKRQTLAAISLKDTSLTRRGWGRATSSTSARRTNLKKTVDTSFPLAFKVPKLEPNREDLVWSWAQTSSSPDRAKQRGWAATETPRIRIRIGCNHC